MARGEKFCLEHNFKCIINFQEIKTEVSRITVSKEATVGFLQLVSLQC